MSSANYAIALIFGMAFGYLIYGIGHGEIGAEDVELTALEHLNNRYSPDAFAVNIENVTREGDVYVVKASIAKLVPQDTEQVIVANTGEVIEVVEVPVKEGEEDSGTTKLKIIEYADFQCPYCERALPAVQQILETYGDRVDFEFKQFPLTSIHPQAQKAAEASECARDQDKFWEYHDILFANYDSLSVEGMKQWASEVGLDTQVFNSCLDSGEKSQVVRTHMVEGQRSGVRGTPAFIIGDEIVSGAQPFSVFQEKIEEKLALDPAEDSAVVEEAAAVPKPEGGLDVVKVVEYADFQCPYCERALPAVQQIMDTYGEKVDFEFKQFPLTSIHPQAQKAAEASECARDQDKFWEYHDILFANYDSLSVEGMKQWASELGLDTQVFNSCLDSGEKAALIRQHMAEGQRSGVRGTPAFLVEDELISGAQPFSVFQEAIDAKLAQD
jgi:protein-disulfide isomerase